MAGLPDEQYLEKYIVSYLCSQPIKDASGNVTTAMEYRQVDRSEYDKDYCVIPSELTGFLKETQPEEWRKLVEAKEGNEEDAKRSVLDRLNSEMKEAMKTAVDVNGVSAREGTLTLIRNKQVFDGGCGSKFRLAYFKPANNKTPEHDRGYRMNRLAIVRQLQYSKSNNNAIDLVIFLNGLPIVTIELKNALTGQNHHNAIKQYICSRKPGGEYFLRFKRCLVHFAVGTEQVYMTTRLAGEGTLFFPFNKTLENEGVVSESGYRTSYLWEDVLRRDNLMDLLQNFVTVQVNKEKIYDDKLKTFKDKVSEALIFPRYHQRRAVHRIVNDLKLRGEGHKYLIQHSPGSGKSNTITWLAFRLSNLFQHAGDDRALFTSVFVVTDRKVLNTQIHSFIRQYQMTEGEVAYIGDETDAYGHTSESLKDAIDNKIRIIITTIQKFPYISSKIAENKNCKYAVIIDEAHNSQSGSDARHMRKALSLEEAEREDQADEMNNDDETKLYKAIDDRKGSKDGKDNVSFFAFTATPKPMTIELFCERENGSKSPFDSYTMEQAIKEGFILDVLKGYMTFSRYYKLVRNEKFSDKEYSRKKAVRLLTSYVDLQDAAIERKSRIMIEHFVSQTQHELCGKARAMLVTRSRLHAVRYKLKFDSIMREMHLPYKCLVAFSGIVRDGETNADYTEKGMNDLSGNISIPQALKMPQYRILIVANKFQTGFDEPLLQTMFVDKKLGKESAVQTLSRLNRCSRGKDTTMVLDFVNKAEDIRDSFQAYYGTNMMLEEDETDPNTLYDVKSRLYAFNAFTPEDVDEFARYYFTEKEDLQKVNKVLDKVCDEAIKKMDAETLDRFRKTCKSFCKIYSFLSQIITFTDEELEKLSAFSLALAKKLPYSKEKLPYDVLKETELDSYKIKYLGKQDLVLESGDTNMKGLRAGDIGDPPADEFDYLSQIIKELNDQFGLELTEEDKVEIKKLRNKVMGNEVLLRFFNLKNSVADVKSKFDEEVDQELLNFIDSKLELYNKLTDDSVNRRLKDSWFKRIYDSRVRGVL